MSNNDAVLSSAIELHAHEPSKEILRKFRDEFLAMQQYVQELTAETQSAPVEWSLTESQETIVRLLAVNRTVTYPAIMHALYSDRAGHEPYNEIIKVFISRARQKLRPFGITIETVWGKGFAVDEDNWKRLRAGFGIGGGE